MQDTANDKADKIIALSNPDVEEIRHVQGGVVTRLCQGYGLIDDAIYFTSEEAMGGVPLRVGDRVTAIAVQGGPNGGWRALRASYEPMKGDWVQAQYFISPTEWSSQACSVSPLRYRRMDNVRVSSVFGSSGVVEDSVFFSLDSLMLPGQYRPAAGDLVNVVVLESSQSFYCWRALCMAPTNLSMDGARLGTGDDIESLLENKGGLLVSSEAQKLQSCELAGWDSEGQFTLGPVTSLAHSKAGPGRGTTNVNAGTTSTTQTLWKGGAPFPVLSWIPLSVLTGPLSPALRPGQGCNGEGDGGEAPATGPSVRAQDRNAVIAPGERMSVTVGCRAKTLGRCSEMLLLHFPLFTIGRRLKVTVRSAEERLLQPSAPYSPAAPRPKLQGSQSVITVLAGPPPLRLPKRHLPNFLGNYPVPQALRDCVEAQSDVLVAQPKLGEPLSWASMQPRFSALLWLEELQAEQELREFGLGGAILRKGAHYLHLEVPGVAEGRPSVFMGEEDTNMCLTLPKAPGKFTAASDRVVLKKQLSGGVVVEYTSYVMEVLENMFVYRGIRLGQNAQSKVNDEDLSLRVNSDFHQSYVGEPLDVEFTFNSLNPSQREAVKRILAAECRPTPYILFGPPGTGKTITLIEAILQVYHRVPSSRLLVCTPSNSAADLICLRLHHSGFLRDASLVRMVLAGDPRQLGPVVKSRLASTFGLGVTKLVYNYRSHESLLSLPSRLFYGGELCVRAQRAVVDSLSHWSHLPTKGFPLIFHGIRGTEMREANNPSWFNPGEAVKVMLYCCSLAKRLYKPIAATDIGVIAPYRKQVEKIRVLLNRVGLVDIKVGSVEEFQGQEFLVIILSTVRSNETAVNEDLQYVLGFLSNPKRFNVAITRPKALLIIVGNPHILIKRTNAGRVAVVSAHSRVGTSPQRDGDWVDGVVMLDADRVTDSLTAPARVPPSWPLPLLPKPQ
ncbi:hypothetical protein JZ751_016772, partial [Albula glossodonta]